MKKEKSILERLADLCRLHGESLKDSTTYKLYVGGANIEFDGRFTEEYEDLPEYAPVKLSWFAVDASSIVPYMNVVTAFTTSFPLMMGDKYNMSLICDDQLRQVEQFVLAQNLPINEEAQREIQRASWIKIATSLLSPYKVRSKNYNNKIETRELDIEHSIDCLYCCNSSREDLINDTGFKTLESFKKFLLDGIDESVSFALLCKYNDYESFRSSFYLAFQSNERYERLLNIIPYVWDIVEEKMPIELYNKIINVEASSAITKKFKLRKALLKI